LGRRRTPLPRERGSCDFHGRAELVDGFGRESSPAIGSPTLTGDQLKDELLDSAMRFARMALHAFLEREFALFLLYAGIALEHLAKAYLASVNPAYLAEPKSFTSLLHITGQGTHAKGDRSAMKTISLTEALKRANYFIGALGNLLDELDVVIDVKNGVAHVGQDVQRGVAERALVPFLKACDALLGPLGLARGHFWKDLTELVETRISEAAQAADIRATEALAAARLRFKSRYAEIEDEMRNAMLKLVEEGYQVEEYEQDLIDCPACGRRAQVVGSTEVVDWKPDYDRDDFGDTYIVGMYPTVMFYPARLECHCCGLRLDGEDELRSARIERSWQLEDVDPAAFADEYEPDDYE
jgi:hypothetical protein